MQTPVDPINAQVGSRARRRRLTFGMEQSEFALKCGMKQKHISMVEHGTRGLTAVRIINIVKYCWVTSDFILMGTRAGLDRPSAVIVEASPHFD